MIPHTSCVIFWESLLTVFHLGYHFEEMRIKILFLIFHYLCRSGKHFDVVGCLLKQKAKDVTTFPPKIIKIRQYVKINGII